MTQEEEKYSLKVGDLVKINTIDGHPWLIGVLLSKKSDLKPHPDEPGVYYVVWAFDDIERTTIRPQIINIYSFLVHPIKSPEDW